MTTSETADSTFPGFTATAPPAPYSLTVMVRGGECYIGTTERPLTVRLHRANFDQYVPTLRRDGVPHGVIAIADIHAAASKFKVPAVTGAGPLGAFNTFVNVRASLPNKGTSTSLKIQAEAFLAQNPDYSEAQK